jgi:hypothetical protein
MLEDIHGTAEYRANLVKVMAKRAVEAAGWATQRHVPAANYWLAFFHR